MTERQALLRTIVDDPADDAPRLVYADWLQENGEEDRAEFIRVQIERSRLPEFDERHSSLQARERRLLGKHYREWTAGLPGTARFRRGLVDRLTGVWSAEFNSHAEEWFEAGHPVEGVWFRQFAAEHGDATQESPQGPSMARLRAVGFAGQQPQAYPAGLIAEALRGSPMPRLAHLDRLGNPWAQGELLATFSEAAEPFVQLHTLDLGRNRLASGELSALAEHLPQSVRRLNLSGNPGLTPDLVEQFSRFGRWAQLQELGLNSLSGRALVNPLPIARESSLRKLTLGGSRGEHAALLDDSFRWGPLRSLLLAGLRLSGEAFRSLVTADDFPEGARLEFDVCDLTDDDMRTLANSPVAGGLRHLSVAGCSSVTRGGLSWLAKSTCVTGLDTLILTGSSANGLGVTEFVNSPNARNLRVLVMRADYASDAVRAIAKSPYCGNLTTLIIGPWVDSSSELDDDAIIALTGSPRLPNLSLVDFPKDPQGPGVEALLEADHIAWPGVDRTECATQRAWDIHENRFRDLNFGEIFGWREPFFDW